MKPSPKTTLCAGKFLALVKEGRWEYVDRIGATGAAIISPLLMSKSFCWSSSIEFQSTPARLGCPQASLAMHRVVATSAMQTPPSVSFSKKPVIPPKASKRSRPVRLRAGRLLKVVTLLLATGLKRVHGGGGVASRKHHHA